MATFIGNKCYFTSINKVMADTWIRMIGKWCIIGKLMVNFYDSLMVNDKASQKATIVTKGDPASG